MYWKFFKHILHYFAPCIPIRVSSVFWNLMQDHGFVWALALRHQDIIVSKSSVELTSLLQYSSCGSRGGSDIIWPESRVELRESEEEVNSRKQLRLEPGIATCRWGWNRSGEASTARLHSSDNRCQTRCRMVTKVELNIFKKEMAMFLSLAWVIANSSPNVWTMIDAFWPSRHTVTKLNSLQQWLCNRSWPKKLKIDLQHFNVDKSWQKSTLKAYFFKNIF